MAATKPIDLCQYDLPSGRLCRQVALKGEHVCRHHARLFRRSEAEMLHDEAMAHLEAELNAASLTHVLRFLYSRLSRLKTAIPAHPEALLALRIALDQLQRRDEADMSFLEFAQQNPMPAFDSPEFQTLMEKVIDPMI